VLPARRLAGMEFLIEMHCYARERHLKKGGLMFMVPRGRLTRAYSVIVLAAGLTAILGGVSYANPGKDGHRTSIKRPVSYARAFGYVLGRAIPKALLLTRVCSSPKGGGKQRCHSTFEISPDFNVVESPPMAGSQEGTYCFRTTREILLRVNAVVLVSVAEPLFSTPAPTSRNTFRGLKGIPYATWIPQGVNCSSGQLEIQTSELATSATGLTVTPSGYVSFSFVIP
jgi:hypothetical protein